MISSVSKGGKCETNNYQYYKLYIHVPFREPIYSKNHENVIHIPGYFGERFF